MKLAILTLDFLPTIGGVQTYLAEIAQRLAHNHQVLVITRADGPDTPKPYRVATVAPRVADFIQTLRTFQPEQILVGHAHPKLLVSAALILPRHYAVLAHGNDYLAAQRRWHRPIFNTLLRQASPLITNSQANAQRLNQLGISGTVVIRPGTDEQRFTPSPQQASSPQTLLTLGRLVPRKGIDTVIRILPALLAEFPELRYRIVGSGPDRARLEAIAKELGVSHRIHFLGRVPDEALPDIYRNAHIFVMPAREEPGTNSVEGFGIVYLEASASGLPVVAGASGGAVEAVKDGETGVLVPPNNPDVLAQTLRRLLSDRMLRLQMGQAGRQWVETEMNWDRVARKFARALQL